MTEKTKEIIAAILGIVMLAGFGWAAWHLFMHATSTGEEWEHLVYVFGALEAIAFTVVGWYFGKEVHRQATRSAMKRIERTVQLAKSSGASVSSVAVLASLASDAD